MCDKIMRALKHLLFILFFTVLLQFSHEWEMEKVKECASIYDGENYDGQTIILKAKDQIPDLQVAFEQVDPVNLTTSFKVHSGCHLELCDEADMAGECNGFDGDTPSFPNQWNIPKSASCVCPGNCKCSDANLKVRECARMYLSTSCTDCDASYTSLKKSGKQNLAVGFQDKISAVVIANHCNATILGFPEDSEEDIPSYNLYGGDIIEDWEGKISSYLCSCDDSLFVAKPSSRNPDESSKNFPPLLNIPKKHGLINSLLSGENQEHPGLIASLQSLKNKRSPTNAYILLLGLTGAGKSTTINLLFDNSSITNVGDIRSTTTNINEYRIPVQVDELGMMNSELRVIDTPGMVDTRGLEQDARYLATLTDFLDKHEDLKKFIPNVILVFAKFDDNRFFGEGSSFVKMLRAIDLFRDRLVDRKYSNVIIVLTHFMSEIRQTTRKPSARLNAIKQVVEEYSLLPKPVVIVVAENKPEAQELPSVNGYYKLPNGDFYPRNLFDRMDEAMYSGGDPVGEAIIRTAFKNPANFNISLKTFPLVPPTHSKVTHFLGVLSSFDRSTESTEISELLTEADKTMSPGMKKNYPTALNYLKRALYKRNIQRVEHIPQTSVRIQKLFRDIQINPANLYLLNKALNLTVPSLSTQELVGYGYDILNDKPLFSTPFDLTQLSVSDIGFQVPELYACEKKNQVKSIFQTFTSKESYASARLASLNAKEEFISEASLKGISLRPGMNLDDGENSYRLTALVEFQNFQFTLKDDDHISLEFNDIVENLPSFNNSDYESVRKWKNFFSTYGTHFIKSAYGGASMEIEIVERNLENLNSSETTLFSKRQRMTSDMSNVINFIANTLIRKSSHVDPSLKYSIKHRGGNPKYYLSNFTQADAMNMLEKWKESIIYEPIMLESNLVLVPIGELVKKIDLDKEKELEKASLALFNASLEYNPPVPTGKPAVPVSRENIHVQGMTGDYTMMKDLASVFKALSDQSKVANENFIRLMMQQQEYAQRLMDLEKERKKEQMGLEMERLRLQELEVKDRRDREAEMTRINTEREELRTQFERDLRLQRIAMENEAALRREEQQQLQYEKYLQLLKTQSEMNSQRRPWHESVLDFGKTALTSMFDAVGKVVSNPAAITALAAG